MSGLDFHLLFFGILALSLGTTLWRAWTTWRAAGRLRQPPPGTVLVEGTTAPLDGLRQATLSGNSCLWEAWSVEVWRTRAGGGSQGNRGGWRALESGASRDPFLLVTPQGHRILVCPDPVDTRMLRARQWKGATPRPGGEPGLLATWTGGLLGSRHRYSERLVLPSQPLFALGHPAEPAPGDPPGLDGRLLPGPGGLLLGQEPPAVAAARARRGVIRSLALGLAVQLLGLAVVLALMLGGPWALFSTGLLGGGAGR
ncbi:hypothetical protein [Roseomonas sp. 18066]|uniref:hypothetical protein n=1 Tax=Roseomonas sp. 18066 TaxID=2681412 RepID=UPI00135CAB83|nr:hypothetical protein [Roseomonas sp. 18066]